jgi:hypothetical protein
VIGRGRDLHKHPLHSQRAKKFIPPTGFYPTATGIGSAYKAATVKMNQREAKGFDDFN